ncbi:LOW QUALITY PROTEIN: hypothetical protein HJC23_010364 [Cyclotella cryptica]|uniref:VDE lipocalin domain-containing protein n=1 Tax=Cyclotella cryptica TaxID=29204 RepID=A0ABD3QHP9_9STRA
MLTSVLPFLVAASISPLSTSFVPSHSSPSVLLSHPHPARSISARNLHRLNAVHNDNGSSNFIEQAGKATTAALLALSLTSRPFPRTPRNSVPANAADGAKIGLCLLKKCPVPLAKCILNPNCLANVICINSCNGKEDETGCQIECGNVFENEAVGEFNKCAVTDMTCVPQNRMMEAILFHRKRFSCRVSIPSCGTADGTSPPGRISCLTLFPVHFFTETAPGKFFGKLNWRIEEPDGEFFTRDALQRFVQDPANPAHLINHDNEYLHYKDDWYIVDYAADDNKEGVPPFAFVYYRGENDAWVGYGGAVIYTRDSKLPESLLPLREAAKKSISTSIRTLLLRTIPALEEGEEVILRQKFAGKMAIQTEQQIQQQAVLARTAATNSIQAEERVVENALKKIEEKCSLRTSW